MTHAAAVLSVSTEHCAAQYPLHTTPEAGLPAGGAAKGALWSACRAKNAMTVCRTSTKKGRKYSSLPARLPTCELRMHSSRQAREEAP